MEDTKGIILVDKAWRMLAEAKTIDEAKAIQDIAILAKQAAKKADLGLAAQNEAAEVHLRAKRLLGHLIRQGQEQGEIRSQGDGRPDKSDTMSDLSDLGINHKESSRAQQIDDIPEDEFESFIVASKEQEKELTVSGALQLSRQIRREQELAEGTPDLPDEKYRILYADPPWHYGDSGVTISANYGGTKWHYKTMTNEQLVELPIVDLAATNAVLFLWVTSPKLDEVWDIITSWGFEYKTSFVWDKVRHNFGYYNSVRHEFLLICGRGSSTPDIKKLYDSVQVIERSAKHSEKPEEFRQIIDELYPVGKRIELFARSEYPGWDSWGNEELNV